MASKAHPSNVNRAAPRVPSTVFFVPTQILCLPYFFPMAEAAESAMPRIMIPANAVKGSGGTAPVRVTMLLLPNCGRSRLDGPETSRRELIGVVVIEDSQMGTAMPVSREK